MENTKGSCGGEKPVQQENPSSAAEPETEPNPSSCLASRTPFTNLSQVDADLALARTLQEQVKFVILSLGLGFLLNSGRIFGIRVSHPVRFDEISVFFFFFGFVHGSGAGVYDLEDGWRGWWGVR